MDRLLNLKLLPYLFEIITSTNDKEFIEISLKSIVTLTQWVRINEFAEPQVLAKLRELKSEFSLAQHVLSAFESNPKPGPPRRWPQLNLTALEPHLIMNLPKNNTKATAFYAKPGNSYGMGSRRVLQPSSNEFYNNEEVAPHENSSAINYHQSKEYQGGDYVRRGYRINTNKYTQMANTVNTEKDSFSEYGKSNTPLRKPKFTTDYSVEKVETSSGKALNLPSLSTIHTFDPRIYIEHVDQLCEKYMDTDLTDKLTSEGKIARKILGIGVIEAAGIKKATGCSNVKKLVEWYISSKDFTKTYSIILYGAITMKKADRVISLLHLISTMKMNYAIRNPHVVCS